MSQFDSVLIFDGECPYCSVAARALEATEDIGAVSWYADAAQRFLDAQFGATPFAMVLVDAPQRQVYAGRAAAEELSRRAGMPGTVGSLVRENYETIAHVVGLASGRGRDPADVHDQYDLTTAASDAFDALATEAGNREPADVTTTRDAPRS